MKFFLLLSFFALAVGVIYAEMSNSEGNINAKGLPAKENLGKFARAICRPLDCMQRCFPKTGYCSYNICYCNY